MIRYGLLTPALQRLLSTSLALLALTGCGVQLRDEFQPTEVFQGLEISGELRTNAPLLVTVTVSQVYPVPVRVACLYERTGALSADQRRLTFEERATRIGEAVLDAAPQAQRPPVKAPTQRLSFPFRLTEPGEYFLACITPAAADNGLGITFRVEAAPPG